MRLAVLTSHPVQYYGPLFRELAGRIDLHVFFSHRATPEQQAAAGFGTAFDWDVDPTSGYESSFLPNVSSHPGPSHFSGCDTPTIGEELAKGGFDAVLTLGWHLKSLWQGIYAAKRLGLPVLVRGDSQLGGARSVAKRGAKAIVYPLALRVFDGALYVGQRSLAYYRHYRYPAERLFFSPHSVDTEWFAARATAEAGQDLRRRHGIGREEKVALFAGKLMDIKRPLDLIDACAQAGAPLRVMMAGSGALEPAVREAATAKGVAVAYLGFLNQTQMPAAYAAADMLVLPSLRETWGLVANEALACGTPIIVSDAAGCAADLAADGDVGRSYRQGDITALADAMKAVVASPPAAAKIAAVSSRYSLSAAADGVIEGLKATAS